MKAVNLGEDTDTTGCVTGGIAGLFYGTKTENNKSGIPIRMVRCNCEEK